MKCPLCLSLVAALFNENKSRYYRCKKCNSIFQDPKQRVALDVEKARYELHENHSRHSGYRDFIAPLIERLGSEIRTDAKGLDFGCGYYPVLSEILEEKGYDTITRWDPFFHPTPTAFNSTYDYILCVEVMEHFHTPHAEFHRLYELLKPGGKLYCMTLLAPAEKEFPNWYYKNDITHVFFYTEDSVRYIKDHFKFSSVETNDRLIIFQK